MALSRIVLFKQYSGAEYQLNFPCHLMPALSMILLNCYNG